VSKILEEMLRSADTSGKLSRPAGLQQRLTLAAALLRDAPECPGPRLLWRDRHGVAQSRRLDRDLVVGRDPACDLVLSSNQVSRQHCRLRCPPGAVWVEDLNSTQGTRVNDEPVQLQRLADGDVLGVGTHALVFVAGGEV
jgi:pSer/pThr/pTyr-binding forkhead associated (FHA) protein